MMMGTPARQVGWVSAFGEKIDLPLFGAGEWRCKHTNEVYVLNGSWLCENALAEALTTRDFGEVAVFGHVAVFGGLLCLERVLMRLQPSLSGSAAGYGHMSATTMPASPPAAVGRP